MDNSYGIKLHMDFPSNVDDEVKDALLNMQYGTLHAFSFDFQDMIEVGRIFRHGIRFAGVNDNPGDEDTPKIPTPTMPPDDGDKIEKEVKEDG